MTHHLQDGWLYCLCQVLVPKLKETDANPSVVVNIMATIGELAQVAGSDMKNCVDELCPFIMHGDAARFQLPLQKGSGSLDIWAAC